MRRQRMRFRTILSIMVAVVFIFGSVAACAPQAPETTKAPPIATTAPPKATTAPPKATATAETSEQRHTRLVEAAKKEGKMVWWATHGAKEAQQQIAAFNKIYPFIEVTYWRGNDDDVWDKLSAEARANKVSVDFSIMGMVYTPMAKKAGLLKKYEYPNCKDWIPGFLDREGFWVGQTAMHLVPTYNTKLVSAAEAPKSWQDLLDPKWKGQMFLEQEAYSLIVTLWQSWGKDKTVAYLKALAANQPVLRKGHTAMTDSLAAGENKLAVELYLQRVIQYKEDKRAPLEWVHVDPLPAWVGGMGLVANSPNPNAGILFADWYTSTEAQRMVEKLTGMPSGDPKVVSRAHEATKGLNVVYAEERMISIYDEATKLWQEIFWPKK